jgi:hypothetical protein
MDGQEVSVAQGGNRGQPRFSRDAIAEFQFLSSRFDATQGRSTGVQVNAITKSGANIPAGSFSGYFRDDNFNAADFIAGNVLPYSNQQLSATFGGPHLEGPPPLLRQLRIRARVADAHGQYAISPLQRPAHWHASNGDGGAATRLPTVVAHAADGTREYFRLREPV